MMDEPKAWIRKYFKATSEVEEESLEEIKGINDIKFSSRPTQAPNQEEEEIERREPLNNVIINKE